MKFFKKTVVVISIAACFLASSCGIYVEKQISSKELTANIPVAETDKFQPDDLFSEFYDEFAFDFMKTQTNGANSFLFSPFSALACLNMIACAASGETLDQFNGLLGGMDKAKIDGIFASLIGEAAESDTVKVADSLWLREGSADPKEDFLRAVKGYYNSEIYSSAFDGNTLRDINNWVNNKTKGMIDKILDEIDPQALAYIVNALYFESAWKKEYENDAIRSGIFTAFDGSKQEVEMMISAESVYFSVNGADCFEKPYKDDGYSFVGILPAAGQTASEWFEKTSGKDFCEGYSQRKHAQIVAKIPEFNDASTCFMNDGLQTLGLKRAFVPGLAELDGVSTVCYLDFVLQKTRIEVSRKGTKAAAVTIGGANGTSAPPDNEIKYIYLDRPFAYAVMDRTAKIPLFIGFADRINIPHQ